MDRKIKVGVLRLGLAGTSQEQLKRLTTAATRRFRDRVEEELPVSVTAFAEEEHALTPEEEGYPALDFVQIGMNQKTERQLAFLLLITNVEITAASLSYLLALPSQLTNVAVLSTRRLAEKGSEDFANDELLTDRLATLMFHCFGRMLNLDHAEAPENYMAKIVDPDNLDAMNRFTAAQYEWMRKQLPDEANDRFSSGGKFSFIVSQLLSNIPRIVRGALQANPIKIASRLPTMIATALSVIVVMIFGAETWDFAASVSNGQLAVFVLASFLAASYLLYRSFSFRLVTTRAGKTSESAVVTAGATYLALLLTLLCLFLLFSLIMYGVIVFVFPDALMSTWTSNQDGSSFDDHLRLTVFLAAVGVLSGSLGGSADSRSVVRNVLFAVDET